MNTHTLAATQNRLVRINAGGVWLDGELKVPERNFGAVIFAHGSGSSRHSSRNQFVARSLRNAGLGTLLFDLLTREEEISEQYTRHLRFNIGLLADRLAQVSTWLAAELPDLPRGFFGASTGGGAALVAAAGLGDSISAVVSRGGRPDLAGDALPQVTAPTLLIVGGLDTEVIALNRQAFDELHCEKELRIVPGASHLFEEPGALEDVANLAALWFQKYFRTAANPPISPVT
jgi:putative phosphoribosyl transferase